jgi:hypothetical protein
VSTIIVVVGMLIVLSSAVFGQMLWTSAAESDQTITPARAGAAQPKAGSTPTAAAAGTPTTVDIRPSRVATAEDSCRLLNLRLANATSASAVSLAQWQKHIDAMNLLVAGKISWAVATTFWDQTRVAAIENVAAFRAADKAATNEQPACKQLTPELAAVAVAGQADAIAACAGAATAKGSVIKHARTAVTTWEHHVHDMEALRRGEITPKQATAAWLKSWKTGEAQLNAYDAAQQRAAASRCSLT